MLGDCTWFSLFPVDQRSYLFLEASSELLPSTTVFLIFQLKNGRKVNRMRSHNEFVNYLTCVNNNAERGVALKQNFISTITKNEVSSTSCRITSA